MPIPNPSLDDKSFQEFVEEARKKIPIYLKTWTDHNVSDPGITFIELFAWLAEMQLYSLNKITDKNRLKFLKLLGIHTREPILPMLEISFDSAREGPVLIHKNTKLEYSEIDQNLIFRTDKEINILPLKVSNIYTLSRKGFTDVSITLPNSGYFFAFGDEPTTGNTAYIGLAPIRPESEIIYKLKGETLTISIYLYDQDLSPVRTHGTERPELFLENKIAWEYFVPRSRRSAITGWLPLAVVDDTTNSLTRSGSVSFAFPFKNDDKASITDFTEDISIGLGIRKAYWIRFRLVESHYEIPPRIRAIFINTVSATYSGETVTETRSINLRDNVLSDSVFEIKQSNKPLVRVDKVGVTYSEIQTEEEQDRRVLYFLNNAQNAKEIADSIMLKDYDTGLNIGQLILQARNETGAFASLVQLREIPRIDKAMFVRLVDTLKDKEIPWVEVEDFDASGPEDHHYVVDRVKRIINFGNAIHGRRLPIGSKVEVTYSFGNIENVLAKPETKFTVFDDDGIALPDVHAKNPFQSTSGKSEESFSETISRARRDLGIPFKAVSASDFEYIATNTPGIRVARAKAFTLPPVIREETIVNNRRDYAKNYSYDNNNCSNNGNNDNSVNVIVVPYSFSENPTPSKGFLKTVERHLDKHRLLTTRLNVTGPEYVGISVNATVTIDSRSEPEHVKAKITNALYNFLRPISRKSGQREWPFGRDVFRSEVLGIIENVEGVDCVLNISLIGSGRQSQNFQNKNGNVIVNNMCLVYLKSYSIEISPSTHDGFKFGGNIYNYEDGSK